MKSSQEILGHKIRDYLIFFVIIPFFLTLVFYSFLNDFFILDLSNPKLIQIYFSNFAHKDLKHFGDNISSYFIIMSLIFIIPKNRHHFYFYMVLFFGVLPFILSILEIIIGTSKYSIGFSGITACLIGYLFFSYYIYIQKIWGLQLKNIESFPSLILAFNLMITSLIYEHLYHPDINIYFYILVLFLLCLWILISNKSDMYEILNGFNIEFKKWWIDKNMMSFLKLSLFFSIYIFYFALFPLELRTSGGKINIVLHFVGYSFGLFVPLYVEDFRILSRAKNLISIIPLRKNNK